MNSLVRYFGFLLTVPLAGFSGDTHEVTVKPGQNVTLQCHAPREDEIEQLAWSRADLKLDKYVFFSRNKRPLEDYQHPSYRGRVELIDPEMKAGDASVILKNVNISDTGTYECEIGVSSTGHGKEDEPRLKSIIKLKVQDSDGPAGYPIYVAIGLLLGVPLVCVIVFVILRRLKDTKKKIYMVFAKIASG